MFKPRPKHILSLVGNTLRSLLYSLASFSVILPFHTDPSAEYIYREDAMITPVPLSLFLRPPPFVYPPSIYVLPTS